MRSCAVWQSSTAKIHEGHAWILGFWSGLNTAGDNNLVGSNTDGSAIIAQVTKTCEASPHATLSYAVAVTFRAMARSDRVQ